MDTDPSREHYDYVVVGAGSAGCLVAAGLATRSDARVLLLEAGGTDRHEAVENPVKWPTLFPGELDWGYETVPQRHLGGRVVHCPRAKMLGGCHSHNASVWVHGHASDFDSWAYQGNPGWDFQSVLRIYRSIEGYAGAASTWRGTDGPLHVELPVDPHPLASAFLEAGREVGLPVIDDHNAETMEGVCYFNLTIKDGRRYTVARAFLAPAMEQPNLTVLTWAETLGLILDGTRCRGVRYLHQGREKIAHADQEVVLCAGAIGSPRVLLLSGIGPAEDLRALGIPVVVDLPGVGQNLQDHVLLAGINYEARPGLPEPRNNGAESTLWWKSRPGLVCPDTQAVLLEFPFVTTELAGMVPPSSYAIAPALVRPASRGHVKLTSADPAARLEIDMNYLACEADLKALLFSLGLCLELGAARAFAPWRRREALPGARDRAALVDFVRTSATTYFHPTSSCRMGLDEMAVVDPELQAYGVSGLRIADASIMPSVTSGNTNAPSVMIGCKAAELILNERGDRLAATESPRFAGRHP
jgi:choline dehydrogenase